MAERSRQEEGEPGEGFVHVSSAGKGERGAATERMARVVGWSFAKPSRNRCERYETKRRDSIFCGRAAKARTVLSLVASLWGPTRPSLSPSHLLSSFRRSAQAEDSLGGVSPSLDVDRSPPRRPLIKTLTATPGNTSQPQPEPPSLPPRRHRQKGLLALTSRRCRRGGPRPGPQPELGGALGRAGRSSPLRLGRHIGQGGRRTRPWRVRRRRGHACSPRLGRSAPRSRARNHLHSTHRHMSTTPNTHQNSLPTKNGLSRVPRGVVATATFSRSPPPRRRRPRRAPLSPRRPFSNPTRLSHHPLPSLPSLLPFPPASRVPPHLSLRLATLHPSTSSPTLSHRASTALQGPTWRSATHGVQPPHRSRPQSPRGGGQVEGYQGRAVGVEPSCSGEPAGGMEVGRCV